MRSSIIIFFILLTYSMYSQQITGRILDTSSTPVPFANIYLTPITDTSLIICGTLSDIKGNYKLVVKQKGKFLLNVSCVGFKSKRDTVVISKNEKRNIYLSPSNIILKEVSVTASSLKKEVNKKTFYITDKMKEKVSSSLEMLTIIPELDLNTLSNKITTGKNGKVKILINGIEASEEDLLAINSKNILKIEYYDIIPARYLNSNIKAVVNVVTKNSLNGLSGLVDAKGAVSTGFSDDLFNLSYVYNKTKITLNYFFSYRNYLDRRVDEILAYNLNNIKYKKKKIGQPSRFGYTLNNINMEFTHKKDSNYLMQFEIKPFFLNSKSEVNQIFIYSVNDSSINGYSKYFQQYNTFQPKVDFYFEKNIKKNQKIISDIFYSYFSSKYNYKINEMGDDTTIMNIFTLNNAEKHSIIGEEIFETMFWNGIGHLGIKHFQSFSVQNIQNTSVSQKNKNVNTQTNIYADYNKKINKFSVFTRLGASYATYSESSNTFDFLSVIPALTLSYSISDNSQIRLDASQNPVIPSLSQLSKTNIPIDNHIIYTGNSNLKPYLYRMVDLSYSLQNKKIYIAPDLTYKYAKHPYDLLFIKDKAQHLYIKTYNNIDFFDEINLGLSATYRPFKKGFIDFSLYSELYRQQNKIANVLNTNDDFYLKVSVNSYYKKFSLKVSYHSDYDMLYGNYINTSDPYSNLELSYKNKNLLLGISIYYLLYDAWYSSDKTVSSAMVYDKHKVSIYDNGNMIVFHLRYDFSVGNKGFDTYKQIENNDNDSGILQLN